MSMLRGGGVGASSAQNGGSSELRSHSNSVASSHNNAPLALERGSSPDRLSAFGSGAHAAVLSAVQAQVISNGAALGLTQTVNSSPRVGGNRASSSNKAAFLLGLTPSKKSLAGKYDILIKEGHVDERDHPELASLDALLSTPLALTPLPLLPLLQAFGGDLPLLRAGAEISTGPSREGRVDVQSLHSNWFRARDQQFHRRFGRISVRSYHSRVSSPSNVRKAKW